MNSNFHDSLADSEFGSGNDVHKEKVSVLSLLLIFYYRVTYLVNVAIASRVTKP